jgi:hypothetical protein
LAGARQLIARGGVVDMKTIVGLALIDASSRATPRRRR